MFNRFELFSQKAQNAFGEYKTFIIFAAPSGKYGKGKMVRCLSGRKERFAKPSYGLNCTEGSNPSLTASFKRMGASLSFFILKVNSENSLPQ